jgi:hypothetical protein
MCAPVPTGGVGGGWTRSPGSGVDQGQGGGRPTHQTVCHTLSLLYHSIIRSCEAIIYCVKDDMEFPFWDPSWRLYGQFGNRTIKRASIHF